MPRLSTFFGIAIYIYMREHFPPHFHAKYGEFEVEIAIKDLRILEGKLPPKALGMVIEWAATHHEELNENWNLISKGMEHKPIEPLK